MLATGDQCLRDAREPDRWGQLAAGVLAAEELLDDELDDEVLEDSFVEELEDSFEEESELDELTVLELLERESVA